MDCRLMSTLSGLDPPFRGVSRKLSSSSYPSTTSPHNQSQGVASKDQNISGVDVKKDTRVFLDIAHANLNVSSWTHDGFIAY